MDGVIRKVVVGDIKHGMSYSVGQHFNNAGVVQEIFIDDAFFDEYGTMTVVVSVEAEGVVRDWKRFPLAMCNIEYDLD
jgi:hypothetical protein